ncbi:jg2175 [Pararge aegeria aegeria]|uniref:Jg2175 protein n=1 Tax=Pararge aegeria aegeria TaxID=348720 RepID=A0A8S4RZ13_9NEOP|nr:jg2175 [Pararge aegeria aegeria]
MKYITKLLHAINNCLIPKLSKSYFECTTHVEFDVRNDNLDKNFEQLMQCLKDLTLENNDEAPTIISSLYILYQELKCDGPWNNDKTNEYSKKLNITFEVLAAVSLERVIQKSTFNVQEIFDKCLEELNCKLTSDDFKKYPGLIEVYCNLLADVTEYNVKLKPEKIFPMLLLLIDDYILINKMKGLVCCMKTLGCMKKQDFDGGNYYEVLYRSLKRVFLEKDLNITGSTHICLIELCNLFPDYIKVLDEWTTQCWCVWQLSSDHKIISTLLKVLYTCKEQKFAAHIQRLIIILICLNNENERKQLMACLDKADTICNDTFKTRIFELKYLYSKIQF